MYVTVSEKEGAEAKPLKNWICGIEDAFVEFLNYCFFFSKLSSFLLGHTKLWLALGSRKSWLQQLRMHNVGVGKRPKRSWEMFVSSLLETFWDKPSVDTSSEYFTIFYLNYTVRLEEVNTIHKH